MLKKSITCLLAIGLFLGAAFAGATDEVETPEQGLRAIVELYKNQDWEGLVKKRCVDTRYANSDKAVKELVDTLSSQFSDAETRAALVATYEAALSSKPRFDSEGTVAIFSSEIGSVKLSKMESGAWGFRF